MFPSIGPMEMAVVVLVVLILFGPGKLPHVFKALGEGVRQFKDASSGATQTLTTHVMTPPTPQATAAAPEAPVVEPQHTV